MPRPGAPHGNFETLIGSPAGHFVLGWHLIHGGSTPVPIDSDRPVVGRPGFIHGPWGSVGNFEVAVSLAAGGLAHYWRDNDDPTLPWRGPIRLGEPVHVTCHAVPGRGCRFAH